MDRASWLEGSPWHSRPDWTDRVYRRYRADGVYGCRRVYRRSGRANRMDGVDRVYRCHRNDRTHGMDRHDGDDRSTRYPRQGRVRVHWMDRCPRSNRSVWRANRVHRVDGMDGMDGMDGDMWSNRVDRVDRDVWSDRVDGMDRVKWTDGVIWRARSHRSPGK